MVGLRKGLLVVAAVLAAVVGAVVVFAVPAARGGSQALVLNASLAPSLPTDPMVFGVAPGTVPWVITAGKVQLQASGMLHVSVEGLVVPPTGANPLSDIAASVYCGGTRAAATPPVPFSPQGNAQIDAMVTLPPFCPAPAVLLNPAPSSSANTSVYIAVDGTGSTS